MYPSCSVVLANSKRRLLYEYRLLCAQVPFFLLCGFVMMYLSTMVFRNLAFYRFEPRPRMRDLGFDHLPDLENDDFWEAIKDIPMTASMWAMGFVCLVSVFFGKGKQTPYAVNMLRRVLAMLSLGHCLRFCTYISTSMPGTTERCLPGHLDEMHPPQPKNLKEVFFTRIALNPGNNCGDLMFSGHILGIVTPVLMASLILMMRNHYTSDIVVSGYVTPLLWNYYNSVLQPTDLELEDDDPLGDGRNEQQASNRDTLLNPQSDVQLSPSLGAV